MLQTYIFASVVSTLITFSQPTSLTDAPETTPMIAQASEGSVLGAQTAVPSPSPTPKPKPSPSPTPASEPTTSPTPKPVTAALAPHALDELFAKYGTEYGVKPELLKHIAKCESTFNPAATNGPYGGMFQFSASTWSSTRTSMGLDPDPNLRFNAEEAIRTTAFKISRGAIGAWPTCGKKAMNAVGSPMI